MKQKSVCGVPCVLICALLALPSSLPAAPIGFSSVHPGGGPHGSAGEEQFSFELSEVAPGKITFTFRNEGARSVSITDIYFDDGNGGFLSEILGVDGSGGVSFRVDKKAKNMPLGNRLGFEADHSLSSRGKGDRGLETDEYLAVVFSLGSGVGIADVLGALEGGELRVGLRSWSADGRGKKRDSLVNRPGASPPVPEPATALLLGSGLGLLGLSGAMGGRLEGFRKRFRRGPPA